MRLLRIFYTLVYVKPSQLFFLLLRRSYRKRPLRPASPLNARSSFYLIPPVALTFPDVGEDRFGFLGQVKKHDSVSIDWSSDEMPMLWRFNQHYFDYLRDDAISIELKAQFITDWIERAPFDNVVAWDPFTSSLRVVNWIFHAAKNKNMSSQFEQSLCEQLSGIERNDERELLANHYFENLKALLFGGVYFEGDDADRWRAKAIVGLTEQLKEQTLKDGGHYERSPQYHCLMVENYLDILNLIDSNPELIDDRFRGLVLEAAKKGMAFLKDIVFPDRAIPLFNDSAFGVAPTLDQLESYAHRLIGYTSAPLDDGVIDKSDSGLYGIRHGRDMLLMDCGDIGPDYQPGHTHCDFLSYELMRDGQRVIVDTGVCEYAPGETRKYLRSTSAHNTVVVNGLEQSEVWGEFRVARRARKVEAVVEESDGLVSLRGSFNGFYASRFHWKPDFSHARQIDVKLLKDGLADIRVADKIRALKGSETSISAESYVHFHPDILLQELSNDGLDGQSGFAVLRGERVVAQLRFSPVFQYKVQDGIYCPEFGRKESNKCLVLSADGVGTLEIGYSIVFT